MRLKTLELQGFKSFPDKTVINFNRGVTVVVGPNGSGKSNISDAMRWVLGEMSTKSIRGTKMEDVIFAGSQKRSPMGYAEVAVTFDNSEEAGKNESLAEYDEIIVTRRYYRVGDSEYFINGKNARLKDIVELFLNTGLGKNGYSIIGQGKIAEIISQKSEERRSVFEEVAGIAKYRYQKNEAERKLSSTEENLVRLSDIAGELEGRIGPLEKEAEKAKKYLEIYERKKAADISLSVYDIDNASVAEKDLSEKLSLSKHELDMSDELLSDLERSDERYFEKIQQNKIDYERAVSAISEESERLHSAEADIRVKENDLSHYAAVLSNAKERLSSVEELIFYADKETSLKNAECEEAEKKKNLLEKELKSHDEELSDITGALSGIDSEKAEIENDIELIGAKTVDARVESSVASSRRETNIQKIKSLEESIEKHKEDISMISSRISVAEEKISGYSEKEKKFSDEIAVCDRLRAENEEKVSSLSEKKSKIFIEMSKTKVKIQNLVNMEELFEGYSRSVKFIMNAYKTGRITTKSGEKPKIYGPVSLLFEVDEKYSLAVETALGGALQNIVTEDEASAKAAISYLKSQNAGRATFCPVTTVSGTELDISNLSLDGKKGFISVASKLVRTDGRFAGIIRNMLGRIIIAENIDDAGNIAKFLGYRYKIVTLDGQVVNAGGSFTGGSSVNNSGMLSRRAQIDAMNKDVAEYEKETVKINSELESISKELLEIKKKREALFSNLSVVRTMKEAESAQSGILISNKQAMAETLSSLVSEYEETTRRAEKDDTSIKELSEKEKEYASEIEKLNKRAENLETEREKLMSSSSSLRDKRSDIAVSLAREEKNLELLVSVANAAKEKADGYKKQKEELLSEIKDAEANTSEAEADIEKSKSLIAEAKEKIAELSANKESFSSLSLSLEKAQTENRAKQKELSHKRELVFREYTKLESEHQRAYERKEKLISFLWDEYELTYSAAVGAGYEKVTESTRASVASEQAKCRDRIKALGYVNVGAIEEFKEVNERYTFLSSQIDDLKTSKDDLLKIIFSLEEQMRHDFAETVELVNANFGTVFSELFGGGHAEISLTDPDNVLESGIEIKAAPPGKVIKSLSLLSGGEQSFIAIALYFAIMKVSPAPFCIMDEIEAALDEVNVDKFADYVKKYSEKTQFVIITHRRGTMEIADTLYGVTMHEKGISEVLSVDVSEIEKKTGVVLN